MAWDLNRRNQFAFKSERTGRFFRIDYLEAWQRCRNGEDVYERILPETSYTPRDVAKIPWTLVEVPDEVRRPRA